MKTSSHGFLALAALVAIPFGAASAVEQAGVTAAVLGNIDFLSVLDQKHHRAKGGEDIYLGDEISSRKNSGMQLMLLDETIFTIGPETDLTIDDFVYDPATGAGRMSASLTKGMFRFVAGKIAQGDPEDMEIKLPAGTIGIRGTSGIVSILNENTPAISNAPVELVQGSVLIVLLETGGENIHESGLVVTAQGRSIELTEPGFGTVLAPNQPPVVPFLVDTSFYFSEQAILAPSASREDEPDEADDAPGGEPGDPAAQGENEPGNQGDGDGRPGGDEGPVTVDGEPMEDDGTGAGDGEPVEGDGPVTAEGEPMEGDGQHMAEGEPIDGDVQYTSEGEPVYGDGQRVEGGFGETDFAGGGYDDGGFYDDGGLGDDFFGEGGFGDEFFGGDGFGGNEFYGEFGFGFEFDGHEPPLDCPDCFIIDGPINGIATVSEFADVFTLFGTADYGGVRDFFQTLLGGSPVNIKGTVTFILSIDFGARTLCLSACTIAVDTSSFGGNILDSTSVSSVSYSGRSGPAFGMFFDPDLTNVNFIVTTADLFDFNDGIQNHIANNLAVLVNYNDGFGNDGSTAGFVPTDPGGGVPQ